MGDDSYPGKKKDTEYEKKGHRISELILRWFVVNQDKESRLRVPDLDIYRGSLLDNIHGLPQ